MSRRLIVTAVKLILASLAVGFVLNFLGVTPLELLKWAGLKAQDAVDIGMSMADWAWAYILLGAGVVVPIWLLIVGVRYLSRRS